jgi:hypothetical protein
MRTIFGIMFCVVLTACSPQTSADKFPAWELQDELKPKLTETFKSVKYPPYFVMNVPHGYQLSMREEAHRKLDMFFGPGRDDKTHPLFMINALNASEGRKTAASLTESMKLAVDGIKTGRSEQWQNGNWEDGSINGVHFMRVHWAGQEPTTKEMMHGFVYGTMIGGDFVEFAAQDLAKYSDESLPLLEGAVQSFNGRADDSTRLGYSPSEHSSQ